MATAVLPDLAEVRDRKLRLHFHEGQLKAWQSKRRFVLVLAGTQGGKTSFGPHWLYREIREKGPGDYLVVAPTFPLLQLKCLPEFLNLFRRLLGVGEYVGSPVRVFTFSKDGERRTFGEKQDTPTNIYFGHAQDPDSLESATAKGAWLDEAGQKKFKLGSWEAILRRLSLAQGRVLLTTTIYNLGWLKGQLYDRWQAGDEGIDVVTFPSVANPAFPEVEDKRARNTLPHWKYQMFYRAKFTRPAGMIYGSFDEMDKVPRFKIPDDWPRYLGLDFGGVNTVGVFYAAEPGTKNLYLYREYHAGGRTAQEHARKMLEGEPQISTCVGGAKSEGQWRKEFRAGGLPVREPRISDVEVGIDRVYGAHKRHEIKVFDDLAGYLEQKMTYSRELDENGEPTEKIEDKETFHYMDAERYIVGYLRASDIPRGPMRKPIGL